MLYLIIILAFVGGFFLVRTRYVDLIVRVSAPKCKPSPLVSSGNYHLGNWKDHSHKMTLGEDGRFETKLRVQANTHVEFKFTLGSWESVEKVSDLTKSQIEKLLQIVLTLQNLKLLILPDLKMNRRIIHARENLNIYVILPVNT